ncbi:SRPBCC domain-containing protein [Micromonospora sp. NPDC023814]|uniref:SRPBCC family protein n=1 Tax=Micromonospora sp. NPDC023814 TaxID=3154596 RepID=UPI0033D9FABE
MTATNTDSIAVDQFVAAPPSKVWRTLTEPELLARWWVPGDIAAVLGHRFHLQMPGWGAVACEVVEVVPEEKLVYTFNESWTLTWRLVAEGNGTRLLFEHSGFDLDQKSERNAFDRMGPGWRDKVLPQLAQTACQLTD